MVEAGKVIIIISVVLWFLASYGPAKKMAAIEQQVTELVAQGQIDPAERENVISSRQLEQSYAGMIGKVIEPVITPLGFDWKIGIALVTSFAAREVFVGTMATIYNLGSEEDELKVKDLLMQQRTAQGEMLYTPATAWALILFYVFALQCMSTMAVVKKETGTWKWPILQFVAMGVIAYVAAYVAQLLL